MTIPHGGKVVRTIDITPTWRGVLPILIAAIQNGTPEGQRLARLELERMADIADCYAAGSKPEFVDLGKTKREIEAALTARGLDR